MFFAIGIATLLFFGCWSKYSIYFFYTGFIFLFLFVVMRSPIVCGAPDAQIYYNFFLYSPSLKDFNFKFWDYSSLWGFGWGYGLLNSICKSISKDYFIFQLINSVFVFTLVLVIFNKSDMTYKEKCFMLFIWFCSKFIWYFFILLRQNIAILFIWIVLINFKINRRQKRLKFIKDMFFIFVAYLFHSTAAIFFLIYPFMILINKYVREKTIVYISLIGSVILLLFTKDLFNILLKILTVIDKRHFAGSYINSEIGGINKTNFLLRILYLLVIYTYLKPSYPYKNVVVCSALAVFVGGLNHGLVIRITEYFAIGFYYGLGKLRNRICRKNYELIIMLAYFMYIVFLVQYIIKNNPALLNYQFFDSSYFDTLFIGGL